jgi:outer membrane receptor protein involved in Fe transport
MVYYTFSQGFRPGGFNQNGSSPHAFTPGLAPTDPASPQYFIPKSYSSDKLTNNEIGWKTEFWDHRLQWNGAVYRENWNDVQVAFFDPGVVGNIFFNTNGQDFLIEGWENSLVARVTNGLTLQGAVAWNFHNEQTNSPALLNNNPASPGYGTPITTACNSFAANCAPVTNPFGPIGSPSANAPTVQFSVRGRYEWNVGGYAPFVQVAATHTGSSFTQAGANPTIGSGTISTGRLRFENPAYTTYDASVGVSKDAWYFTVFGQNLSNSNASTFVSTDQFIVAQTPLRPRVIGGEFGYKF